MSGRNAYNSQGNDDGTLGSDDPSSLILNTTASVRSRRRMQQAQAEGEQRDRERQLYHETQQRQRHPFDESQSPSSTSSSSPSSQSQQLLDKHPPSTTSRRREDRYSSAASVASSIAAASYSNRSGRSPRNSRRNSVKDRDPNSPHGSPNNPIAPEEGRFHFNNSNSREVHASSTDAQMTHSNSKQRQSPSVSCSQRQYPSSTRNSNSHRRSSNSTSIEMQHQHLETTKASQYHLHEHGDDVLVSRASPPKRSSKKSKWFFQKRLPLVMSASHDSLMSTSDEYDNDGYRYHGDPLAALSSSNEQDDARLHFHRRDREKEVDGVFSDDHHYLHSHSGDLLRTKQSTAVFSILLTCIQLLILCLQLAMCGIASFDINPFVGPFPDAFDEWGGKNPYKMVVLQEWWRIITPSFLHVGILHLLANAFCQLEPIALFEREWGSTRWLFIYVVSSVACQAASSLEDPNTIAVGSSGALMGLFAAKLAQVFTHLLFRVRKQNQDDVFDIRLDQLSSVLCGLMVVSLLSFFTYIDWSGHMGALVAGLFAGMMLFSNPIASCCAKVLWMLLGLLGLVSGLGAVFYFLLQARDDDNFFDSDLADACAYFRSLFPEGYECGCLWQQES